MKPHFYIVPSAKQAQLNTAWAQGLHAVRVNRVQRVSIDNQAVSKLRRAEPIKVCHYRWKHICASHLQRASQSSVLTFSSFSFSCFPRLLLSPSQLGVVTQVKAMLVFSNSASVCRRWRLWISLWKQREKKKKKNWAKHWLNMASAVPWCTRVSYLSGISVFPVCSLGATGLSALYISLLHFFFFPIEQPCLYFFRSSFSF